MTRLVNRIPTVAVLLFLAPLVWGQEPKLNWKNPPHPRLYLNPARIANLRKGLHTTYADIWPSVQKRADAIVGTHPPTYSEDRDLSGDALWWEMDVASSLPDLALAYLVTGEKTYFDAVKEWTLASCAYPHWGTGTRDGGDLAAGFMLTGVSVVYDWLYADLDPSTRDTLRRTLIERGRLMFQQSKRQHWKDAYLQNHLWVTIAGLGAAAFALMGDPQASAEAATWISTCLDKFRRTEALLGPDGASHEGISYWGLGVDGLQRFWSLASDLIGENTTSKWWAGTGYYRLYLSLPRNAWTMDNKAVDFADALRQDWVGPDYLLRRLAAINHDGHIQWLANQTAPISVCTRFGACWLNPIWYDPSIKPIPPDTLPTLRHFPDMGIVSARSDWSGDESLVAFKCGPALGHFATNKLDQDAGSEHVHPDANHFVLFGAGEWLIRDDGYRPKVTDQHNTLVVDGRGQLGEGKGRGSGFVYGHITTAGMFFSAVDELRLKVNPRITAATTTPAFDYMVGDATEVYPKESGLRRFVRQIVFLKPDVLIVADDILTDRPRNLDLRFHPQFPAAPDGNGAYISKGKKAVLRVEPFPADNVQVIADYLPAKDLLPPAKAQGLDKLEVPLKMFTIQLKTDADKWRNAVALSWSAAGQSPARVTLEKKGENWVFRSGGRSILVKWDGTAPELISGTK